jgi:hypothetical protein
MANPTSPRRTADEIKREVTKLTEQIGMLERAAREQNLAFSSLDPKQLERKASGETSNSPYIFAQMWTSAATPGTSAIYRVYVQNPDPFGYFPFYASIYYGLGNFLGVGEGWVGRDLRWPGMSSERTVLPASTSQSFDFNYKVPTVPLGTYNGNAVIWRGEWHDVGTSFDRGSFDFKVL